MEFNLDQIFPEELTDKEISNLADIFMELALAIDSHYHAQITRYHKSLRREVAFSNNDELSF